MELTKLINGLYLCSSQCDACYKACLEEASHDALRRCMNIDL